MAPITENAAAEQYAKVRIETAPHKTAIYILHEKCLHLVSKAFFYADARRANLDRAQNILVQLQSALAAGRDDPVSQGLFFTYDYCYRLLERGDVADIRNARLLLERLCTTFRTLLTRP